VRFEDLAHDHRAVGALAAGVARGGEVGAGLGEGGRPVASIAVARAASGYLIVDAVIPGIGIMSCVGTSVAASSKVSEKRLSDLIRENSMLDDVTIGRLESTL
jgi:hypothetical protein